MPETTRLAATIATWWPQIEAFLELGVTNARTEGYNRVIKQVKRVACGFRNQANYERRIMTQRDHQRVDHEPRQSAKSLDALSGLPARLLYAGTDDGRGTDQNALTYNLLR